MVFVQSLGHLQRHWPCSQCPQAYLTARDGLQTHSASLCAIAMAMGAQTTHQALNHAAERGRLTSRALASRSTPPRYNSRNREVFASHEDLSGAVPQVLYQQSKLHENWLNHRIRPELQDSRPDAIKCVVITGMLPQEGMQRQSLDVFRNACKNVEVITFDELLGEVKFLSDHMAPR